MVSGVFGFRDICVIYTVCNVVIYKTTVCYSISKRSNVKVCIPLSPFIRVDPGFLSVTFFSSIVLLTSSVLLFT